MNRLICVSMFLVATLVSGCGFTFTTKVKIEPRLDSLPQTTKSPVHVGVYYSPQFANQEYVREVPSGREHLVWVVPIGVASVRLFDDILPHVFEKTTRVSKLTEDELSSKGVDIVIAPSLEYFDFRFGTDRDSDWYSVSYRMTLYTKRGVPVASWVVFGNAKSNKMGSLSSWIEDDMTNAADKFLKGFEVEAGPTLTAIANNPVGQSIVLDPKIIALSAKQYEPSGFDAKQLAEIKKLGVVAVQVTVRNDTERQLVARTSDMRLLLKDGLIIEPLSVGTMLSILEPTSEAGSVEPIIIPGNPFTLLSLLYVAAESTRESQSEWAAREKKFNTADRSLYQERTMSKGKEATGVVFFRLPEGVKAEDGAALTVWVVDPALAEGTQAEVSLSLDQ